jgi:GNAT superfamily N-acetyltransferase
MRAGVLSKTPPAGFALYFFNYSTFLARRGLYLEDLFVVPALRGRGVGKALLMHLARIANARGCGRMEWTVLDWNQPAIEFYESIGARRLREWQICRLTGAALERFR